MRVKVAKHKDGIRRDGVFYPKESDGYCEIPNEIAQRFGFIPRAETTAPDNTITEEPAEEDAASKDELVEMASGLGLGAPSTLKRWSVERLEREIAEAGESDE